MVFGSYFAGTRPSPLTRIFTEPGSIPPIAPRFALMSGLLLAVEPSAGCGLMLPSGISSAPEPPPLDDPPKVIAVSKTFGLFASIM